MSTVSRLPDSCGRHRIVACPHGSALRRGSRAAALGVGGELLEATPKRGGKIRCPGRQSAEHRDRTDDQHLGLVLDLAEDLVARVSAIMVDGEVGERAGITPGVPVRDDHALVVAAVTDRDHARDPVAKPLQLGDDPVDGAALVDGGMLDPGDQVVPL